MRLELSANLFLIFSVVHNHKQLNGYILIH